MWILKGQRSQRHLEGFTPTGMDMPYCSDMLQALLLQGKSIPACSACNFYELTHKTCVYIYIYIIVCACVHLPIKMPIFPSIHLHSFVYISVETCTDLFVQLHFYQYDIWLQYLPNHSIQFM